MLWAITPAQIAFRQPSMLRRLTYELQVDPILNVFSKDYLLQNYGSPELVPKRLVLYSAWGRFVAAWSFLRLGWYCFGLGALLVGAYAIAQMPQWQTDPCSYPTLPADRGPRHHSYPTGHRPALLRAWHSGRNVWTQSGSDR